MHGIPTNARIDFEVDVQAPDLAHDGASRGRVQHRTSGVATPDLQESMNQSSADGLASASSLQGGDDAEALRTRSTRSQFNNTILKPPRLRSDRSIHIS